MIFEINVKADGHVLTLQIKLPPVIEEQAIDEMLTRFMRAFDELDSPAEAISREELLETLSFSGSGLERRLLLRRPYTDPAYPFRFAKLLRGISGDVLGLH